MEAQHDKKNQLERIKPYVIAGEVLHAVFDCKGSGTGFVGITDRRVIFYDQSFFSKKKQMVSVPFRNVIGITSVDEGTFLKTSEITLLTSVGNFAFQFRGADKAHWTYEFIMSQILARREAA